MMAPSRMHRAICQARHNETTRLRASHDRGLGQSSVLAGLSLAGSQTVKVLLADDDARRSRDLAQALAADPSLSVVRTRPGVLLADAVRDHAPDLILIDMSRPDRDALEPLRSLGGASARPVVLFVDSDDPGFMEDAIRAGVCSYNVQDAAPPDIKPILRAAVALFRRHAETQANLAVAEARLRERALIDRAKSILIGQQRLAEPDAHRWLQRRAMAGGRKLVDVAEQVIRESEARS